MPTASNSLTYGWSPGLAASHLSKISAISGMANCLFICTAAFAAAWNLAGKSVTFFSDLSMKSYISDAKSIVFSLISFSIITCFFLVQLYLPSYRITLIRY